MTDICKHLNFIISDKSKKGKFIYKNGLKFDYQIGITWNEHDIKINEQMHNDIKLHIIGGKYVMKNLIWIEKLKDIFLKFKRKKYEDILYINVVYVQDGQVECYLTTPRTVNKMSNFDIFEYIICKDNTLMIKYFVAYNNLFKYIMLHGMCLYNEKQFCEKN